MDDVVPPMPAHAPACGAVVATRPEHGGGNPPPWVELVPVPFTVLLALATPVHPAFEARAGMMRGDHDLHPPFRPFVGASCRSNSASANPIPDLPVPISALMITELGTRPWLGL